MPRLTWVFAGRTCHFVGFCISFGYSLEVWQWGTSYEYPQHMFLWKIRSFFLSRAIRNLRKDSGIHANSKGIDHLLHLYSLIRVFTIIFWYTKILCRQTGIKASLIRLCRWVFWSGPSMSDYFFSNDMVCVSFLVLSLYSAHLCLNMP